MVLLRGGKVKSILVLGLRLDFDKNLDSLLKIDRVKAILVLIDFSKGVVCWLALLEDLGLSSCRHL